MPKPVKKQKQNYVNVTNIKPTELYLLKFRSALAGEMSGENPVTLRG